MKAFLAGIFCFSVAVCGSVISASAEVIASCGSMDGYSYFFGGELADNEPGWVRDSLDTTTIFLGADKVEEVVLKSRLSGEDWTRSASDYGAPVIEVTRDGSIRHVLILWGPVTELYALDTEKKSLSLVSHKSGLIRVTHAYVGKCE